MKRRSISHTVRITSNLQKVLTKEKQDGESYGAVIERLVAKSRPDMEVQSNPGRGKKFCPVCNLAVGIRTKVCECGTKLNQPYPHQQLHVPHPFNPSVIVCGLDCNMDVDQTEKVTDGIS